MDANMPLFGLWRQAPQSSPDATQLCFAGKSAVAYSLNQAIGSWFGPVFEP
jgi:hypothetical protein